MSVHNATWVDHHWLYTGWSTPTVNVTIIIDWNCDDPIRLQIGRNMFGGVIGGKLDWVWFWAGLSFGLLILCHFSFLACGLFHMPVRVCASSACYGYRVGCWEYGDDSKEVQEDGRRSEPRASHQVTGEPLCWEHGSHHYQATHLSGYVTGLWLSQLCITPLTGLKIHRWTPSETSPIT